MSSAEENPDIGARAVGGPELDALKELPADKRRAMVEELETLAQERPETAPQAQVLMEALRPKEEEE